MRRVFIINEVSGCGKAIETAKKIGEINREERLNSIMIYTTSPREAVSIAHYYAQPNHVIYSVGGDGTLNEVVEGIIDSDTRLGIVPAGTGNDFAKVITDTTDKIDVISINDRYAINIISFGIDAEVANEANILKKKGVIDGVYWKGILHTVPKFKCPTITLDGIEKSITLLAVCNGKYYGNGFPINGVSNIQDGMLELYVVDGVSKLKIPGLFMHLKKGTHLECEQVKRYPIQNLEIYCTKELVCNLDGEIIKDNHYRIGILPQRIQYYQEENQKLKQLIRECGK